jgi:hypothetical protein
MGRRERGNLTSEAPEPSDSGLDSESRGVYDKDEIARLWSHGLHEDDIFLQRSNFFLVAQSLLLVAYADLVRTGSSSGFRITAVVHMVAGFGLILTAMWMLLAYRQNAYMEIIRKQCTASMREYKDSREMWLATKERQWWGKLRTYRVMSYGVPTLAAVLWLLLLIIV